jgi:transcriptional regulator with XRE-family HTH domain
MLPSLNRLRELRNKKGLTQKELGKIFKLSESAIGMYERNERRLSIELAITLADYFEVDTDYLTGHKELPRFGKKENDEIAALQPTLIKLKRLADEQNLNLEDPDDFNLFKKAIEVFTLARDKK